MCSNPAAPYLVGVLRGERKALVVKANCDMWECIECAKRKQSQWVARAIIGSKEIRSNGMALSFITITSHEKLRNFAASAAVFPHAWGKLYQRMKRKNKALTYLLVIEKHKTNDRIHAHFLSNLSCSNKWMKDNARECGLGYQAKVKVVDDETAAAGYVSKYIGKSLEGDKLPRKFRRVRCSQNWAELPQLEDSRLACDADWLVCNTHESLWWATEKCQAEDWTMIDANTGEYFDYGGAIETWYH